MKSVDEYKLLQLTKHTAIEGVLVRIGGRDKTAHAQIQDLEDRTWNCEVDRDMARRLAPYLFGAPVRLMGEGRWQRTSEGQWELIRLKTESFALLDAISLSESVEKIRAIGLRLTLPRRTRRSPPTGHIRSGDNHRQRSPT